MSKTFYRNEGQKEASNREKLNQYLRGASIKAILLVIGAVIVVSGLLVWVFSMQYIIGIDALLISESGETSVYVLESDINRNNWNGVSATFKVDGHLCEIESISERPDQAKDILDPYEIHVSTFEETDWIYTVRVKSDLPDTVRSLTLRLESFSSDQPLEGLGA